MCAPHSGGGQWSPGAPMYRKDVVCRMLPSGVRNAMACGPLEGSAPKYVPVTARFARPLVRAESTATIWHPNGSQPDTSGATFGKTARHGGRRDVSSGADRLCTDATHARAHGQSLMPVFGAPPSSAARVPQLSTSCTRSPAPSFLSVGCVSTAMPCSASDLRTSASTVSPPVSNSSNPIFFPRAAKSAAKRSSTGRISFFFAMAAVCANDDVDDLSAKSTA
mmetsp:Transcript_1373/g.4206  ORF Transcript_1373/g.4206 Transcript_1373/m.4206 type:complete len:222 (+) Transcript_1373:2257-2922(+)